MDRPVVPSASLLSKLIQKLDKWQCEIWWTQGSLFFSSAELQLNTATECNMIGWRIERGQPEAIDEEMIVIFSVQHFTVRVLIGMHRQAAFNVKPWWSLLSDSWTLDNFHLTGFTWNSGKPGTTCNHVSSCVSEDYEYQRWHHGRGAEFALVIILSDFSKLHLRYRSPRRRSVSRSRSRYKQILIFVGNGWGNLLFVIFNICPPLRSVSRDRRRYRSLSKEKNNRRSRSLSRSRRYFFSSPAPV